MQVNHEKVRRSGSLYPSVRHGAVCPRIRNKSAGPSHPLATPERAHIITIKPPLYTIPLVTPTKAPIISIKPPTAHYLPDHAYQSSYHHRQAPAKTDKPAPTPPENQTSGSGDRW